MRARISTPHNTQQTTGSRAARRATWPKTDGPTGRHTRRRALSVVRARPHSDENDQRRGSRNIAGASRAREREPHPHLTTDDSNRRSAPLPNYATNRQLQRYEAPANDEHDAHDCLSQRAKRERNHDRTTFQPPTAPTAWRARHDLTAMPPIHRHSPKTRVPVSDQPRSRTNRATCSCAAVKTCGMRHTHAT